MTTPHRFLIVSADGAIIGHLKKWLDAKRLAKKSGAQVLSWASPEDEADYARRGRSPARVVVFEDRPYWG